MVSIMKARTYLTSLTVVTVLGALALNTAALGTELGTELGAQLSTAQTDNISPADDISPGPHSDNVSARAITPPILSPYKLSADQSALLETNVPVLDVWEGIEDRRIVEVFGAIHIDASPAQIWEIMTDCEKQFQIISNMTKCEIETEDVQAGWDERVQIVRLSPFLPRVTSKFRSEYSPYRQIKITRTGGDLAILDGLWNLTTTPSGQTRVTYRARLKPKFPVPRKIMQRGTAKDMPEVLKNLRDIAEAPQPIHANEPIHASEPIHANEPINASEPIDTLQAKP